MNFRGAHIGLLRFLLTITLTCAPLTVFPAPKNRAEAVVWIAAHGRMPDQALPLKTQRGRAI
jgi:hypothetical protein